MLQNSKVIFADLPKEELVPMGEDGNAFYHDPTHTYWEDGTRLISATGILKICGDVDDRWYKPEHAMRGKLAHVGCHQLEEKDINWNSWHQMHPEIVPYIRSYEIFLLESGFKSRVNEKPHYHKEHKYGVTTDSIGEGRFSKDEIVERKTGSMQDWTAIQTALQAMAYFPTTFYDIPRWGVELNKEGKKPRVERFDDPNDFAVALCKIGSVHYTIKKRGFFI